MLTVLEIIKKTTDFLAGKGVENPRLNAELLVGHGLGLKRMQLYLQFERSLTPADLEVIRPLVRRRGQREPLQYILGETEFFGLKMKTDRRALIPRPETEYLLELLVGRLSAPATILDLGTGGGAIALALAKQFPAAVVTAVDVSSASLELATENQASNGLEGRVTWLESNWFEAIEPGSTFDLIVANPPYLSAEETAEASPEVREHEPASALTSAGTGGIADLEAIIRGAPRFLRPGGLVALETGIGHHNLLRELAERSGLGSFESVQDLTGRDRFVFINATQVS